MIGLTPLSPSLSPSYWVPARYFILGFLSFPLVHLSMALGAGRELFRGNFLSWEVAGIVHWAILGWLLPVVLGALHQLIPVLLNAGLRWPRLADLYYVLLLGGLFLLLAGFLRGTGVLLGVGGGTVLSAVLLALVNLGASFVRSHRERGPVQYYGIGLSLLFLGLTAVAGGTMSVLLALNSSFPFLSFLGFHISGGMLGWLTVLIVAVAYRLIPMFSLSHGYSVRWQPWALALLAAGAAGEMVSFALAGRISLLALGAVTVGFLLFLRDVAEIVARRRRREMEPVTLYSLAACAAGLLALFSGWVSLAGGGWRYGVAAMYLGLFGWGSLMAAGQMLKIVPFLTWLHRFGERAGKEKVPLARELYSEKAARFSFFLLPPATVLSGLGLALGEGTLFRAMEALAFGGSLVWAFCMWQVVAPVLFPPRMGPLPARR